MRTGKSTTTTTTHLPVSISDDLRSAFYSGGGLPVRVVTAGELPQNSLCRPIGLIKLGDEEVVTSGHLTKFERGPDRVVTILKPTVKLTLLWGFKRDVGSNKLGEPNNNLLKPGSTKKITDPDMLREKRVEQDLRKGSFFLPYTSGHVNCDGFRLHKNANPNRTTDAYLELICNLNPKQMHEGYLLDPRREASFHRIAETMANILVMENTNGNGNSDAFQEPVTLYMYDSYRGILLPPEKLDRATVEKIQANANTLSQYGRSMSMEGNLYGLLAQSGCERFLSLLKEIPENVTALAEAGAIIPLDELQRAINRLDTGKFHDLLSSVDETLLNRIGLPDHLLTLLLFNTVIHNVTCTIGDDGDDKFNLQNIDPDRLRNLMTDTFPKQAEICRTLLKHGLFFPVISSCQLYSSTNPLVVCLLIAHGARADFYMKWKMNTAAAPSLLHSANEFFKAGLLTEEEVKWIRHDVLHNALCVDDLCFPCTFYCVMENLKSLVFKLRKLALRGPTAGKPPTEDHNQVDKYEMADGMCCELLGEELWRRFCYGRVDSVWLSSFFERGLCPQRYSDEELRRHLDFLSVSKPKAYFYHSDIYHRGDLLRVYNRAVTKVEADKGKHADWLTSWLATPPAFDRGEFARVGRYRAITQTAGQHYYQYHHPNSAQNPATNGVEYVHRRYHGIDHALRTQMATEFLIEILPFYHRPFQQLLATYPALPELLKIAELYHDAVAEDEPKNTEELRAAELFERDMRSLNEYPNELITLVATALKNKNSNEMSPVKTPFTADDECSPEELLLRKVLRFGDVVDMLRLLPLQEDFLEVKDSFVINPMSTHREPGKFDPQAIELLAVVDNPIFTRMIKAALLTFRDLAALTGGWHLRSSNPAADRYQLQVDNQQRRLLVEHSPDPYTLMREVLDDLVRLEIAKRAGISTCLDQNGHRDYAENGSTPGCWDWDKATRVVGTYRKLHSEVELRQVRVPKEMTLTEKVHFVSELELPATDRPLISFDIRTSIAGEINRLRQEGIQPATGTPSQGELQKMYERPDSIGACILNSRGIAVQKAEHDGRTYFRMVKL